MNASGAEALLFSIFLFLSAKTVWSFIHIICIEPFVNFEVYFFGLMFMVAFKLIGYQTIFNHQILYPKK